MWISINDRLPDDGEWCLVYAGGPMNCMGYSNRDGFEDWVRSPCFNILVDDITHWMPLPDPPKQEIDMAESELQTYKRTLELIAQELGVTNTIVTTNDKMSLRLLRAQALKIQVLADNALARWSPATKDIPPMPPADLT